MVNIKKFYVRRILRIWPLYFLYLLIVVFYIGVEQSDSKLLYYFFFIPNVSFVIGMAIPLLGHYWSLGVEEQFYIFWPWIVQKSRQLSLFLIAFIILFLLLKISMKFFKGAETISAFLHYTRFGCMAIGALAAHQLLFGRKKLTFIYHPVVEFFSWLCLMVVLVNRFHVFSIIDHEIISIISAILILNQVANPRVLFSLDRKIFNYLGRISFGLYVYNPLVIVISSMLVHASLNRESWISYAVVYAAITCFVIIVAHLSFYYFEQPFLKWKDRFSVIKSSNQH